MQGRRSLFWRRLALLPTLLLVPALCVAGAFASHLQITSPYFSLSFGPQRAGQPPMVLYNDDPPLAPGNSSTRPAASQCLLGLLCLSVDVDVDNAGPVDIDINRATATANPTQVESSSGCLLGVLCIATAQPSLAATPVVGCESVACIDAGLSADNNDLSLNVGAEVPAVGSQLGTNPDNPELNLDLDLQNSNVLDTLQVGVGGGSGSVSIGLTLPSLFP